METSGGREAEFIGTITASATHEMRNVLAIVKESAGLIEDLVHASSRGGGPPHSERILKATGRIDAQVARGAEIVTRLNRFAHSMDEAHGRVDLAEEVREVAFLSQRLARAKHQTVEAASHDGPVWLIGNSLHVQMALYAAVAFCLSDLPEGAAVEMRADGNGPGARAHLAGTAEPGASLPGPSRSPAWARLEASLADFGIGLQAKGEGGYGVRLLYEGGG
jgi:uncharacterized iron-regulated membrane protein